MDKPSQDWAEIRGEAERRFLGREQVVAIAVARRPSPQLVFFLERDSEQDEADISQWAQQCGVEVQLKVTGGFRTRR